MRKFIIIGIILFSLLVLIFFIGRNNQNSQNAETSGFKILTIGSSKIFVEIAGTPQTRAQGLSDRPSLPKDQGMLFIFEEPGLYSFWMKDMNFALDFVWISKNLVTEVTPNVQPQDFQPPKNLTPKNAADMVLEINAGLAEKLNIKPGDKIIF